MAGDAVFLGWGQVVRGREQMALTVFQEAIGYYTKLQQDGRIESFEPVLLEPHSGDLFGYILIRGERAALDSVRDSADFRRLTARAGSIVDNVGVVSAYTSERVGELMTMFGEISAGLPQAR